MAYQDIFSAWEIGLNWEVLERDIGGVGEIARAVEMPVYLSRLRSIDPDDLSPREALRLLYELGNVTHREND